MASAQYGSGIYSHPPYPAPAHSPPLAHQVHQVTKHLPRSFPQAGSLLTHFSIFGIPAHPFRGNLNPISPVSFSPTGPIRMNCPHTFTLAAFCSCLHQSNCLFPCLVPFGSAPSGQEPRLVYCYILDQPSTWEVSFNGKVRRF